MSISYWLEMGILALLCAAWTAFLMSFLSRRDDRANRRGRRLRRLWEINSPLR